MAFFNDHPTVTAVLVLALGWLVKSIVGLVQHRKKFSKLPGPPHHPAFGHLIAMGEVVNKFPKRVHPHAFAPHMQEKYGLGSVFYMDTVPFAQPMMVITDPELSLQIASDPLMVKAKRYHDFLEPICGRENLLLSEGAAWKHQRAAFNPGFSPAYLMEQVPQILDVSEDFVKTLDRYAEQKEVFRVEEAATKLTVDIVGKIVLDHDFKSFSAENKFLKSVRNALSWLEDTAKTLDPLHRNNPVRPLAFKYYKRQMDKYIGDIIDERFRTRELSGIASKKRKTGIDLALRTYFKESGQDIDSKTATLDLKFREIMINNMLILIFAGHDTTASTVCYIYHMLSKHPEALAKVRREMDEVFGVGIPATEKIREDPYILNKCEYAHAVIKETLRLWNPASTVREGPKGHFVKDPATGEMLPTEGCMIWSQVHAFQRDRSIWGEDAYDFKPERFLDDNIPANAFRPFEKGPRNCIGQELAMIELRIVMAVTIREFDVWATFDELDKLNNDGTLWNTWGAGKGAVQEVYGERMYQVLWASAKPVEGMPARVKRRDMRSEL